MQFARLFNRHNIFLDNISETQASMLRNLSNLQKQLNPQLSSLEIYQAYIEREQLGSTAIGNGILLPHISLPNIHTTQLCFIKLSKPIDCFAVDKQPIDLVIGIISNSQQQDLHLQLLALLVENFANGELASLCRKAQNIQNLYNILSKDYINQL